jgi:ethylbenzene dioxygenase beta subunit
MSFSALRLEFEELLIEEAWLLDNNRLEDWLGMLSEELSYRAPVRANVGRGEEGLDNPNLLTHFEENKFTMGLRVKRLRTGAAHAEEPPSRIRHFVSNVRILDQANPDRVQVSSNEMVFRSREGQDEHLFVAERRDWWRREEGRWRCVERLVLLEHDMLENLTVFF